MTKVLALLFAASNVAELRRSVWSDAPEPCDFALTCTVTAVTRANGSCWVSDRTGYGYMRSTNGIETAVGDRIEAIGHVGLDKYGWRRAFLEKARTIERGVALPPPLPATAAQLADESLDGRTVVMRGTVADVVRDEIDPRWRFLLMRSESGPFFAALPVADDAALLPLIGATVSAKGVANVLPDGGKRKFQTPQLTVASTDDISVTVPAPEDPALAPQIPSNPQRSLENVRFKSVGALSRMGPHSVEGDVIAVWAGGSRILVKTDDGQIVGAALRRGPPPRFGDRIVAAGLPTTDLFTITLASAWFRRVKECRERPGDAVPLQEGFPMEKILRDICARGQAVGVRGMVVPHDDENESDAGGVFSVRHGSRLVKVDASALAGEIDRPLAGSIVEVSGTCVRNTSPASGFDAFPRTDGFTLVPRTAADVTVLASPPWWTAKRLFAVILALVAVLSAVLYRQRMLRRIAKLRLDERTRLAVELHDSIAQTLTGVSFQVDAAAATLRTDADSASRLLAVARRTLLSCREELRRCLWDLRSETLAEPRLQTAIEKAIRPSLGGAEVRIRFAARRSRLPDTTAHNVISVIRELCVNAVRDGRARHVRVAGEIKDGLLRIRVRDDGCGFDPSAAPGPSEGHFGLAGVRERVRRLKGVFSIESRPGAGTKAMVEVRL